VGQAAMRAGTASMITAEGRGALPAGMYSPTALRGRRSCSHRTPGSMSSASGRGIWAAWNACTLASARSRAAIWPRSSTRRARAHALEALEGLPEDVLAAHRVDRDAVRETLQRNDGRGLRARQEPADLRQGAARGVQHDVLALAHLLHTIDAHQQPLHPLVLGRGQIERGADEHRVT